MENLPARSISLLVDHFGRAPQHTLSVDTLHRILSPDEYEYHIAQLSALGFIEVADTAPASVSVDGGTRIFHSGAPTSFRLSYGGLLFLAAREEERNERAQQDARYAEDKERAEKQHDEDRRYSRNTAIIASVLSCLLTLLIERLYELIVWGKAFFAP